MAAKHLAKQLTDQRKSLSTKQSDAGKQQQARLGLQHRDRVAVAVRIVSSSEDQAAGTCALALASSEPAA